MAFRLRKDARKWFRGIKDVFELDFDMYFLCLMAGFADGRKVPQGENETTKLIPHFPGGYREYGRVIVATFLTVELEKLNVNGKDRATLNASIDRLVDPNGAAFLSGEGVRAVNMYAHGGFDCLTEWFEDRPYSFSSFFPAYIELVGEELRKLDSDPF